MANIRMTLLDLLNKDEQGADPGFLRDGVRLLAQELMDAEVTQLAGAGLHERSENRLTYRNGYREREWDTRVGTIDLHIPSSAKAPTSRACWSLGAGMSGRC
jgi:putative transposase